MDIARRAILIVAIIFLTACATYGNKKLDDVNSYLNLREGHSTKDDVYLVFGQPHDVRYAEGDPPQSMWVYYKMHTRISGWTFVPIVGMLAGGDAREATRAYFTFDPEARLVRIQTKKQDDYENMWAGTARKISRLMEEDQAQRVEKEMSKIGRPFDKKTADSVSVLRDE